MDPLSTSLSYMFVALFKDALNEYAYAAEISGLMYDLHTTIYGLTVREQRKRNQIKSNLKDSTSAEVYFHGNEMQMCQN